MDIREKEDDYNAMQGVKRRFFAFRNGALADVYRKGGDSHQIIFGLNIPQLKEIAQVYKGDKGLAEQLWSDIKVRESRLLAPMLVDPSEFNMNDADRWMGTLGDSFEVADVLCHSLLRHIGDMHKLVCRLKGEGEPWLRYVGLRLSFNLLSSHLEETKNFAKKEIEREHPVTKSLARQLLQEVEYLLSDS